uniref:Minor tail protein n=1 Tax=Mycobacterium phage BabyBack TaxID=3158877 RepID=A0AAU8GUD6_9CAUD
MSNPILVVDDAYTVYYHGRKFALASPPTMVMDHDPYSYRQRYMLSFEVCELPPPPPPKPKRTWATAMGLRRPNG